MSIDTVEERILTLTGAAPTRILGAYSMNSGSFAGTITAYHAPWGSHFYNLSSMVFSAPDDALIGLAGIGGQFGLDLWLPKGPKLYLEVDCSLSPDMAFIASNSADAGSTQSILFREEFGCWAVVFPKMGPDGSQSIDFCVEEGGDQTFDLKELRFWVFV